MAVEIRDPATGQIKTWVWLALAVVVVGIVFLASRVGGTGGGSGSSDSGSGGFTPSVGGGQSSDITGYLDQLNSAIIDLQGSSNVPTTNATPPAPNPTNPQDLQDIIDQLTAGNKVLEQAQQNLLSYLNDLAGKQEAYSQAVNTRTTILANRETANRSLADLKLQYQTGKINKATYNNRVKIWTARLATYNTQLTTANTTIANIQSAIDDLQAKIAAIGQSS